VLPGATLGVLGSGQLGRMFAIAARRMGYRVHTFSPGFDTPTGQVADVEIDADYDDLDAIRAFARQVDVITFEFENVTTCTWRAKARSASRSSYEATTSTSATWPVGVSSSGEKVWTR
jgi:5-(carboxyamino)imidazole ribonucleotide synthase